ncbi:MAG: hypothetical protein ChlgKO_08800 [Chlamydiales bacterium]
MANLILCGLKNAGKTTFGKKLSRLLNKPFIDTDGLLGNPRELYLALGEKAFREKEKEVIESLEMENGVIALGGGALILEENRRYLRALGTIVYIHLEKEEWLKRVADCDSTVISPTYYETRVGICRAAAHVEISYGD